MLTSPETSAHPRPTRTQLDEKRRYFREMKNEGDTENLKANVEEVVGFAQGQGEKETRDQWYPEWTKQDFKDLLKESVEEGIIDQRYLDELETRK